MPNCSKSMENLMAILGAMLMVYMKMLKVCKICMISRSLWKLNLGFGHLDAYKSKIQFLNNSIVDLNRKVNQYCKSPNYSFK